MTDTSRTNSASDFHRAAVATTAAGSPPASTALRAGGPEDERKEHFRDYLNQQSITFLERSQKSSRFDAAEAILAGSVYKRPGETLI